MEVDTGSMPLLEKKVRATDLTHPVKITRELPLWGILTAIFTLVSGAVSLYFQQKQVFENQLIQTETIKELSKKIDNITVDLARKDGAASQFDYRITNNERRLNSLESKK